VGSASIVNSSNTVLTELVIHADVLGRRLENMRVEHTKLLAVRHSFIENSSTMTYIGVP
jgi:hypothetical protein